MPGRSFGIAMVILCWTTTSPLAAEAGAGAGAEPVDRSSASYVGKNAAPSALARAKMPMLNR